MKNLKNFAFGLLVAVLAVGFSAFTPQDKAKSLLMYRYANNGSQYVLVPASASTDDCAGGSVEQCLIESDTFHADGFQFDQKPSDYQVVEDSQQGIWTP